MRWLSQFNACHGIEQWTYLKRILRYLKGTANKCLVYQKSDQDLTAFVDADFAGDIRNRKSFSGWIFKLGNCAISWESKKQCTVALSTTEAEYMALSECCKEAIYLKRL